MRNKLVAEAFYLTGRIEKYGSGFSRIRKELQVYPHVKFTIEEIANGILVSFVKYQSSSSGTVTGEVTGEVMRLLKVCDGEKSRSELQHALGLKHEEHFRSAYLVPALEQSVLEMTKPEKPKSRMQRYRLTQKGKQMVQKPSELD